MSKSKVSTDVTYTVLLNDSDLPNLIGFTVRRDRESYDWVQLECTDLPSKEYFGNVALNLPCELAIALGEALVRAGKDVQTKKVAP